LKKIDPNTGDASQASSNDARTRLPHAAIATVLAGFFKFTRTDKGCNYILAGGGPKNWLDTLFEDNRDDAVEKVAQFADVSFDEAAETMEDVAREAVIIIHEGPGAGPTAEKLKAYMSDQRHTILVYLPPALQIGELLNEESMDDRTNKMEGPVSNLIHNIENKFSGGGSGSQEREAK
jgi:hypothetical protein